MKYHPSEPRPYSRRGKRHAGRWEIDLRGVLDNGLVVKRERRVFPVHKSAGKIGKRQAAAMAQEEFQRWNRHGQVLRPGETPVLPRTGAMTSGTAPTFAQFAPDFLEFCASPSAGPRGANAPSTIKGKEIALRVHLLPIIGSLRMDQLRPRDVNRYISLKTAEGRAYDSIGLDVSCLNQMLKVAESYELIDKLPKLRPMSKQGSDVVALDPDEARRFSETSREHNDRRKHVLLELYLRTGLRCGEALGLYPADFNLEAAQPTVRVERSWNTNSYGPTKGRKTRIVPIIPKLAAELDELFAELGVSTRSRTQHPFSSRPDMMRPVVNKTALAWVRATGKLAKTRPVRTHMLRHTFGTDCARRGIPVLTIQEWLGHVKVEQTMTYLHLVAPDHLRWAEMLTD